MINKITLASMTALAGNAIEQKSVSNNLLQTDQEKCAEEKEYVDKILEQF
jgi:hypothetical protein